MSLQVICLKNYPNLAFTPVLTVYQAIFSSFSTISRSCYTPMLLCSTWLTVSYPTASHLFQILSYYFFAHQSVNAYSPLSTHSKTGYRHGYRWLKTNYLKGFQNLLSVVFRLFLCNLCKRMAVTFKGNICSSLRLYLIVYSKQIKAVVLLI